MSNIKAITLYNFKAFYGETKIELDGKNLLLYGENGSGKSSVYWALYTLLQSVNKENPELNKYFDFSHPENLINTDYLIDLDKTLGVGEYDSTVGNNVQIEVELDNGKVFNLSRGGLSARSDRKVLSDLNRYCDFLTHRLLINFYNFRNSQKIDLWPIFMRDIFPFVYEDLDKGKRTIENLILDLKNSQPFKVVDERIIDLSREDHSKYFKKIRDVNIEIWKWIHQISNESNLFLNKFFQEGSNNYKIELKYSDSFFYGQQPIFIRNNGKTEIVQSPRKFLRVPKINLNVYKKSSDDWLLIDRPQTYLNEALINQIALAIRLSVTANRAVNYAGQFLVLDDILISLDMSNREKVLDIILNEFAPKYKIYLFTHEKSFFNMVSRRLYNRNLADDWLIKEMYMNDFVNPPKPIIVEKENYLSVALKHLKNFDLPACANYLRKECELRMKYLLPDNLAKQQTEDETKYAKLENQIKQFLKFYAESLHQDVDPFFFLKEKKDLILNPLSHDNLDSEIYKHELLQLHNVLLVMRKILKVTLVVVDRTFTFNQIDVNSMTRKYNVKAKENICYYKVLDGTIIYPNIDCEFIGFELADGTRNDLNNHKAKYKDLQKVAHTTAMKCPPNSTYPDHLQEFTNEEGKLFQDVIDELMN